MWVFARGEGCVCVRVRVRREFYLEDIRLWVFGDGFCSVIGSLISFFEVEECMVCGGG